LNIDVCHNGLGVEHKMLRVNSAGTILSQCGTTKMHPAGTRSIRIPDIEDENDAMNNILGQYGDLIDERAMKVQESSPDGSVDMRTGWMLWKDTLDEFLYFEEPMRKPIEGSYFAKWNVTPRRGSRKESRSLWIFEKASGKKKFSVTTTAGAKIQPYFDVPSPYDPNLYYFKVQGVLLDGNLVRVWLTRSTVKYLELLLGDLSCDALSAAILDADLIREPHKSSFATAQEIATPVTITVDAYNRLKSSFTPVSDEYLFQQLSIQLGSS
jgi:hypothetical protein